MVLCAAYGCCNRSDKRGKGTGISFFAIPNPNPRKKPAKKDLAARWLFNIGTGWTVDDYSFNGQAVCQEHFEESCFADELQARLGFTKKRRLKPDAVPTIFNFDPTQMHVKQRGRKVHIYTELLRRKTAV